MKLRRSLSVLALIAVAGQLALGVGCAKKVDRITIDKIIATGMEHRDMDRLCGVGHVLGVPMAALGISKNAEKSQVMADVSSALCVEPMVREAQLDAAFARHNLEGEARVAASLDARYREERAHSLAAYRYQRAWNHLEAAYGPVGADACPKIAEKDELVYLMGLYAGLHGMIHDKAGGGQVGVPMDVLGKVARGAACIDNERWWHVPASFRAAAHATLLFTEEGDPWERLDAAASAGEASGIRLARAVQVMTLANADRQDDLRAALTAHAAARSTTAPAVTWAAMDTYAYEVSRHELDRLWATEKGHRAPSFDVLPGGTAPATGPDAFGADPFGADPFGGGAEAPAEGAGSNDLKAPEETP